MYRGFLLHHFKNAAPLSHIDPDFRPAFTCISTFLSSAAESSPTFPVVWINPFFGRWDFHSHSYSTDNSSSKSSCFSAFAFPSLAWESGPISLDQFWEQIHFCLQNAVMAAPENCSVISISHNVLSQGYPWIKKSTVFLFPANHTLGMDNPSHTYIIILTQMLKDKYQVYHRQGRCGRKRTKMEFSMWSWGFVGLNLSPQRGRRKRRCLKDQAQTSGFWDRSSSDGE